MIERPLDQITAVDLARLVDDGRPEGRRLDFKRDFPEGADKAVREFLADVSSMANTDGGDILLGVEEDGDGVALALPGVPLAGLDEAILRIESQVRECLDPRLAAFHVHPVPIDAERAVIILRVGASLVAPHRVTHKGSSRFYARNSRGKFEMDTGELRLAFAATDELPRKLRDFHARAVAATTGTDMPFRLSAAPAVVATVAPLSILRENRDLTITRDDAVLPPRLQGFDATVGLDGVILHDRVDADTNSVGSWAVNHRRGYVDFAWTIGRRTDSDSLVWRKYFEDELPSHVASAVTRLRGHGLEAPWVVMVTVQGAAGHRMILGESYPTNRVWQDPAYLGEIVTDRLDSDSLTPFIERFWRLFGVDRPPAREHR